jgi:hypothetical protein
MDCVRLVGTAAKVNDFAEYNGDQANAFSSLTNLFITIDSL